MALRQRASLRRTQTSDTRGLKARSANRSSRNPRSSKSQPTIKLVPRDASLEVFLDPKKEFDAPLAIPANRPQAAPSKVDVAVRTLGELESVVIAALFPPAGGPPATLEEVSEELGMSVAEVRNIADEALRGLRGGRSTTQRLSKAWN